MNAKDNWVKLEYSKGFDKELQALMAENATHDLIDGAKDMSTNSIKGTCACVCVSSTGRQRACWNMLRGGKCGYISSPHTSS